MSEVQLIDAISGLFHSHFSSRLAITKIRIPGRGTRYVLGTPPRLMTGSCVNPHVCWGRNECLTRATIMMHTRCPFERKTPDFIGLWTVCG